MTLKEAIEISTRHLDYPFEVNTAKLEKATKLGIEALKFTLAVRGTILSYATLPLPGED